MVFVGNNLRFAELSAQLDLSNTVFTSNIKNAPQNATLVNYSDLTNQSADASDSSGIMVLKLLIKLGVTQVALAGYDGFSRNQANNYAERGMAGLSDPGALEDKSRAIEEQLNICAQRLDIAFITKSRYKIS
jgi:4-hydroxy 2-oxovalerate aldolase